jgi:hypothetical protein
MEASFAGDSKAQVILKFPIDFAVWQYIPFWYVQLQDIWYSS